MDILYPQEKFLGSSFFGLLHCRGTDKCHLVCLKCFSCRLSFQNKKEIKFSYTEWTLSTRYILGYQFSHLSSDSDFLPYSATFFLNLPPFAIWTKKVWVCHQFIRFSKLFLFLPLSFEGCEESAVALSYGGQMTFILWELIKLLFRSDSCIISDLSLALYNHLFNSNSSFKKY